MGWGINIYDLVKVQIHKPCNGYYLRWYYNGFHYWFFAPGKYSSVTEGEKYRTIGTRKITMGTGQITRGQAVGIRTIMMTREVSLLTTAGWKNIRIEPGTLTVYESQIPGAEIEFTAIIGSKEISYTSGFSPVNLIPVVPPSMSYCEIIIGSQIWMCYNWDSKFPGSKVYNNDEGNRPIYRGLYTWSQIMSPGFVPADYHIPALTEWQTLITYAGGGLIAGGKLKEVGTTHWNPGVPGTDDYGFAARSTGYYYGVFGELMEDANLWTATEYDSSQAYFIQMDHNHAQAGSGPINKNYFLGVRLIKNIVGTPHTLVIADTYSSSVVSYSGGGKILISQGFRMSGNAVLNSITVPYTATLNTPDFNVRLSLYNNVAGLPTTLIADSLNIMSVANMSTPVPNDKYFYFANIPMTAGDYCFMISYENEVLHNAGNNITFNCSNLNPYPDGGFGYKVGAGVWTLLAGWDLLSKVNYTT